MVRCMNLKDFIKHVYPPYYIFNRKDRGFIWKLSKWTGIRAAFIFYKLGISANFLNVITYFIIVFAFYLILKIEQNLFFQPLIGLSMLIFQYGLISLMDQLLEQIINQAKLDIT